MTLSLHVLHGMQHWQAGCKCQHWEPPGCGRSCSIADAPVQGLRKSLRPEYPAGQVVQVNSSFRAEAKKYSSYAVTNQGGA